MINIKNTIKKLLNNNQFFNKKNHLKTNLEIFFNQRLI